MQENGSGEPDSPTTHSGKSGVEQLPDNRLDEQGRPTCREVTLIQCTNSKRDTISPARELYDTSSYFRHMRDYAEAVNRPYYILSAKHGLVPPHKRLKPYDEFGLSEAQAIEVAETLAKQDIRMVKVIAGKKYTNHLIPELEKRSIDVVELCAGLRIGERIKRLKELTREWENETLC